MKRPLTVLTCAAVAGAASVGLASLALFTLAVGIVILLGADWAVVALSARRLNVQRVVPRHEVQEDSPVRLRFAVRCDAFLPARLEVEDHSGRWLEVKDGNASVDLRVGRPGAYWLGPTRMRLRDPLGLFERGMLVGRAQPLLILPAPVSPATIRRARSGLIDDPEPQGLSPYAPGASFARIHWPSLARGAGLHVRQLTPARDRLPLVVVDTAGATSRDALDWTARTAAGYILTLSRLRGCRVLLPGDRNATPVVGADGSWRGVHRRLATLGDLPPPTAPSRAAATAAVHVRAAAAPARLAPAPPLPHGVLSASECAPHR
jgi:uncharacterized protein (DUF58 family)